jgi:hypothetical protein
MQLLHNKEKGKKASREIDESNRSLFKVKITKESSGTEVSAGGFV